MRSSLKTILTGCLALWGMCGLAQSTCTAAFTYTVGSNGQVNFTNTSTGGGTFTSNYWDFGDGVAYYNPPSSHTYLYNGTYAVSLIVTDSTQSCSSTFTDSITITNAQYNYSCNASFTYTVNSGGTVNFTNTSVSNLSSHGYSWNFGDGWVPSTQTSPSHTYYYNGTYYVTLQITDSLGYNTCSHSQYVTITGANNCNIQASFTYTMGINGVVTFSNTTTGSAGPYDSNWLTGDGIGSVMTSPTHTYSYNGTYAISLHVMDQTGGGVCDSYAYDSIVVTNASPAPSCNATFTYTTGTSGLVNFTGSQTGTISSPAYQWDFGDGNYTNTQNASHTYAYNGTYNVYFYVTESSHPNYGCSYYQQVVVTNTVSGPCQDSVYFTLVQDTAQASTWDVYLYSNNLNSITGATWTWGDGTSSTGIYPSHTYSTPGWYSICVEAYFACADTATYCQSDSVYRSSAQMISVYVINTQSGIQTNTSSMTSLQAYPNPFTDDLTVKLTSYENKPLTCSVFDMMGNLVLRESVLVNKGDNEFKLKTADMGKGVYFIQVSGNGKTSTLKVVK